MPPFQNCSIYSLVPDAIVGFPRRTFATVVTNHGGKVASSPEQATHIIVHHEQQPGLEKLRKSGAHLCSVLWFFACIEAGNPLSPDTHHLYGPFPGSAIDGTADYGEVTYTGFTDIDRTAARVLTEAAGLCFRGNMNYSLTGGPSTHQTVLLLAKDVEASSQKTETAK